MKRRVTVRSFAVLLLLLSLNALAKPPIRTPPDTPIVGDLDAYLLDILYKTEDTDAGLAAVAYGMRKRIEHQLREKDLTELIDLSRQLEN